jgi:hypothetical protein
MDALLHRVRKAKAGPFEAELDKMEAAAEAASSPPAEQITFVDRRPRTRRRGSDTCLCWPRVILAALSYGRTTT